jgi:hypothetical protein
MAKAKKKTTKRDKAAKPEKAPEPEVTEEPAGAKTEAIVNPQITDAVAEPEQPEIVTSGISREKPSARPEGAPAEEDCIAEYETATHFIYKLKSHRKICIAKG